jgi:hypothetical protein
MRQITYEQATLEAIQEEFRQNPKSIYMATDLMIDLQNEFGEARVRVS